MAKPSLDSVHDVTEHLLSVRGLLRGTVLGPDGQHLGDVIDAVIRLRDRRYPLTIGVLAFVGGREVFLPDATLMGWQPNAVQLNGEPDQRSLPHHDDVVLSSELLGQRLSDLVLGRRVRVHDLLLAHSSEGWTVRKIDTRGWVRRQLGWHIQRDGRLDWKTLHSRAGYQQDS